MDIFEKIIELIEHLIGPQGCPWDRKQTFSTLQPYLIEETHEVIEAVDEGKKEKMIEELGDLLYVILFYIKIAEKEQVFKFEDVLKELKEKLIRRHPHVFGEKRTQKMEEIIANWEAIKKQEQQMKSRNSALDGIPKTLPILIKAQKIIQKVKRTAFPQTLKSEETLSKEILAKEFFRLIVQAEDAEFDMESLLRAELNDLESRFRTWEADHL